MYGACATSYRNVLAMSNVNAVGAPVVEATTLNEELDTLLVQASLFRHSNQQILGRNGRQRRGLRSLLTLHLCNSCQVNNVNCRCAPVSECILHQQHSTILNMQSLFPCSLTCTSCPYERSSLTPCSRGLVCCFQKPQRKGARAWSIFRDKQNPPLFSKISMVNYSLVPGSLLFKLRACSTTI